MTRIMYRDTKGISPDVYRRDAILKSQPPSGGLYVPTFIPKYQSGEIESLEGASLPEIGYSVMSKFLRDEMPDSEIQKICQDALDPKYHSLPIEHVMGNIFTERQGRGQSGAFKDTAARLLAREASYYIRQGSDGESYLLVATSGDTGAAIASAFHNVPGINVIIAYPSTIYPRQAKLMNTYGDNIIALECKGDFGDLQEMFMTAFGDKDLEKFKLWSANSIGIGRAQPQVIHAVWPLANPEIAEYGKDPVFVVPSGNFGHTYAFLLAKQMGAYDERLVVANNANDVFHRFMKTRRYDVRDTVSTLSSAMDVDDPSNVRRIVDLYGGRLIRDKKRFTKGGKEKTVCRIDVMPDIRAMRRDMWTTSVTDKKTRKTIKSVYEKSGSVFETHGGVGMTAALRYIRRNWLNKELKGVPIVVMSTANPAKFPQVLDELGIHVQTPEYMLEAEKKPSNAIPFSNKYKDFKEFLISGKAEKVIREQKSKS